MINLFILGLPKAGTTSLYDFLCSHNDIEGLKIKESHIFNDNYGTADYHDIVIPKSAKYVIDASVSYLYDLKTLESIIEYNPSAKFIFIHREFISRIKSHYLMDVHKYGLKDRGLTWYWNDRLNHTFYGKIGFGPIDAGRYSHFYGDMKRTISSSNLLEVNFEDMINGWPMTREAIGVFLGLTFEWNLPSSNSATVFKFNVIGKLVRYLPPRVKSRLKTSFLVQVFTSKGAQVRFSDEDMRLLQSLKELELKYLDEFR